VKKLCFGDFFMNINKENRCRRCGAVIRHGSSENLCPACLMSGVLKAFDDDGATISLFPGASLPLYGPSEFPFKFGDYRLLGLLGRGGMGTVYEAEQLSTGRRVALKMLAQQFDSPDMRQRFLREGRLAASINHPNSLYIYGSEEIDGVPVITMEIAGAGTLKDKLKKCGPLPYKEAVDAILDVISGLDAAFAMGVLHRDIKPSNCFVSPQGPVKVGDFGLSVSTLARNDTFVTAHGKIMGTPAYSSPEQLRGDTLDVRADIYSVGATLFTLLTNRPPFEGDNAVQVVANAVKEKPIPLTELRDDVPPGLERAVNKCLAKEPNGRYSDYEALRNALLPFSSKEPEPASIKVRASAGWIDYLIAFLIPYVIIMLSVGAVQFHLQPFIDRTLYSARYYIAFLCAGFLYFSIAEGIWGAGFGKHLKGLRVIRTNGKPPGILRALIRIFIPILCIEVVRIPFLLATISVTNLNEWTRTDTLLYVGACNVFPWLAVLLILTAHRENGFATVWDLISGTRVVVKPKGIVRPLIETLAEPDINNKKINTLGPYQIIKELVQGKWFVAVDPVLRRRIWLLRRDSSELSLARRNLSRSSRLRWLQKIDNAEVTWDAFEAVDGVPFSGIIQDGKHILWSTLRHWLHDAALELWEATGDETLPTELSLDNVWITSQGHAVLLDLPWPDVQTSAESIPVGNLAGQQRFLSAIAACVNPTTLPLHARTVLKNLAAGKFEKLSFLTGTLRGLLDKPSEVNKGIRTGSIFMLPIYIWVAVFIGYYQGERVQQWNDSLGWLVLISIMVVSGYTALTDLLGLLFHSTASHAIFGLAVVNTKGELADRVTLLRRWAIVWLPLFFSVLLAALLIRISEFIAFILAVIVLILWFSVAVYAAIHPNRSLQDRLAGTWVVRR
jgi:uncharacterized RDD family membrane protein YckC